MKKLNIDNIIIDNNIGWIGYSNNNPINFVSCLFDSNGIRKTNSVKSVDYGYANINYFNNVNEDDIFITVEFINTAVVKLKIEVITLSIGHNGEICEKYKRNIFKENNNYTELKTVNSDNYCFKKIPVVFNDIIKKCIDETEKEFHNLLKVYISINSKKINI